MAALDAVATNATATSSTSSSSSTPATINLVAAPSTQTMGSSTGVVTITPAAAAPVITLPASRIASFAARSRVILFGSEPAGSLPGTGPYWINGKWTVDKIAADQLYYVANIAKDLNDAATTAASVIAIAQGVAVLEGPTIQGTSIVVKIGGFDPTVDNFCTLRITCADGEQIDRTIHFNGISDSNWVFGKDPDDIRFYGFDLGLDASYGNTSLASVTSPTPVGVSSNITPFIKGNIGVVKVGGFDTLQGDVNSFTLTLLLANTEKFVRTIYFSRVDN